MRFKEINNPEAIIEIIAFNYDGKGGALYHYVGDNTIRAMALKDLLDEMLGPNGGSPQYELFDSD